MRKFGASTRELGRLGASFIEWKASGGGMG